MNIDDRATQLEEFAREMAIKARKPELIKTGFCYNCGDNVNPSANYCDADCRLDYDKRNRK